MLDWYMYNEIVKESVLQFLNSQIPEQNKPKRKVRSDWSLPPQRKKKGPMVYTNDSHDHSVVLVYF